MYSPRTIYSTRSVYFVTVVRRIKGTSEKRVQLPNLQKCAFIIMTRGHGRELAAAKGKRKWGEFHV